MTPMMSQLLVTPRPSTRQRQRSALFSQLPPVIEQYKTLQLRSQSYHTFHYHNPSDHTPAILPPVRSLNILVFVGCPQH